MHTQCIWIQKNARFRKFRFFELTSYSIDETRNVKHFGIVQAMLLLPIDTEIFHFFDAISIFTNRFNHMGLGRDSDDCTKVHEDCTSKDKEYYQNDFPLIFWIIGKICEMRRNNNRNHEFIKNKHTPDVTSIREVHRAFKNGLKKPKHWSPFNYHFWFCHHTWRLSSGNANCFVNKTCWIVGEKLQHLYGIWTVRTNQRLATNWHFHPRK